MAMQDDLMTALRSALKAGDKRRVSTVRMLLAELKNEQISSGEKADDAVVARRYAKKLSKAIEEYERLEERHTFLVKEQDDLIKAKESLLKAISKINRTSRQLFRDTFEQIRVSFREMFSTLFGGGKADLVLDDETDLLECGIEIVASPPGKKLQILSLLSGGEQALTALALLFSVFLTNPAPICVLDEVDAPLDDANVDRFCRLLAEIAESSATRFLIITHHRMTMARMDRLYGVTMPEQGVSQLVSVDLQTAEELRDSA